MTMLIMKFKPEKFWPVPSGTILKYLTEDQNYDTKEWTVRCEVIGWPSEEMSRRPPIDIPTLQHYV